jgi:hypothetical protein
MRRTRSNSRAERNSFYSPDERSRTRQVSSRRGVSRSRESIELFQDDQG